MTLTLIDTGKTFADGTVAVRPTSLTVGAGEIVSLLGPSGCGKTTLLRMIAGLETPDPGGTIRFDGDDVTVLPVERRQVGMVFQSYALFPNMSVRANVGYGLKMQGVPHRERRDRVAEILGMCRLDDYAERAVTALSGGQKQRVALARAVAPRPRVLLLDEPLSALDAALRDQLREELAQLLRRFEITAIFVTHDQAEALAIADRVAVMQGGRIEQLGRPQDLYRRPASAFVATFVGHAVALEGHRDGANLHLPGGTLALPDAAPDARAYVRPEDVNVDAAGPLVGTVQAATFLGTHYRLALTGVIDGTLHAHFGGPEAPAVGRDVRVAIAPDAVLMIPSQADTT